MTNNDFQKFNDSHEDSLSRKEARLQIYVTIGIALLIIICGILFYHHYEGLTWVDSWYFVMVTLTTVGYGDISPQTKLGKFITPIFILIGIGIITSLVTGINKYIMKRRVQMAEKRKHIGHK